MLVNGSISCVILHTPKHKSEASLQVQSPKGGCLNWKGPKAPSPQYKPKAKIQVQVSTTNPKPNCKSKASLQVRGPTASPKLQRRLFRLERAEGPFSSLQTQNQNISSKFKPSLRLHYNSDAPLQVQSPVIRKLFKLEGAAGPFAPMQTQSRNTSSRFHYKSKA